MRTSESFRTSGLRTRHKLPVRTWAAAVPGSCKDWLPRSPVQSPIPKGRKFSNPVTGLSLVVELVKHQEASPGSRSNMRVPVVGPADTSLVLVLVEAPWTESSWDTKLSKIAMLAHTPLTNRTEHLRRLCRTFLYEQERRAVEV